MESWHRNRGDAGRVRVVQMHLNVVTTLSALPLTIRCCDDRQSYSAAVALQGLRTDEIDRDWIYDTGAGTCFMGIENLTSAEKHGRRARSM